MVLAAATSYKAQQAIDEPHWGDVAFKKEAYSDINKMIAISGTTYEVSRLVLKKFRWGMEFMDEGNLREVIEILAEY